MDRLRVAGSLLVVTLVALGGAGTGSVRAAAVVAPPLGDVNGDGAFDARDLNLVLHAFLSGDTSGLARPDLADVAPDPSADPRGFGDGRIRADDLNRLFRAFTGIQPLPVDRTPAPVLSDFTPKSASAGAMIAVAGSGFAPRAGVAPRIFLSSQNSGTLEAAVSAFTATGISFILPTGAASGPLLVSVLSRGAVSAQSLTIMPSSTASLTAAPSDATVIQGQSVSYAVSLASANGFARVAPLSLVGLPAGMAASFKPMAITAGQMSILTVTAPAGQPTGSATLTVTAAATVDGIDVSARTDLGLTVAPVTTSFLGRTVVDDATQTPLAGVTVTFLGQDRLGNTTACSGSTVSDEAGNFGFMNLPAGCNGTQLVRYDGSTATAPPGTYAGVNLSYTLVPGQVTTSPVLIHLPRLQSGETVLVQQNAPVDQTFTFKTIPNLSVTVYAGTTLTLKDGTTPDPFPLVALDVPVDRLPDTMPNSAQSINAFIVAFQPADATASQPVAVTFPNTLDTPPGTDMPLTTLDPTRGVMAIYGSGTVSADGTQIVPDPDPQHPGHRYGLVHFDWHGPSANAKNAVDPSPQDGAPTPPSPAGPCDQADKVGGPIDLSSGVAEYSRIDMVLSGGRGSIAVVRSYRTMTNNPGPFGIGTGHNYSYALNPPAPQGAALVSLIVPDGSQIPFARQADGTLTNATVPGMRGAVMRVEGNGAVDLRWKDGSVYRFVPANFRLGSLLASIIDPNGNTVTLTRNAGNPLQITQITDPVGRSLALTYDGANRVTAVTDPIGRTVSYAYNGFGTIASVTDPAGGVTQYDYETSGGAPRLTKATDPRGIVTEQNAYDANGRVIRQAQADGGVLQFAYTLLNPRIPTSPVCQTVVTDPLGRQRTYRFNPQGFRVQATDATGQVRTTERASGSNLYLANKGTAACGTCSGAGSAGDVSYTYDAAGNVLTRTDALGNTTTFTYEPAFNKVSSVTDPLGGVTRFMYDDRGNLLTRTDENGKVTSLAYNPFGQVTQITDPLGAKRTFAYDAVGNLTSTTDPLGNASQIAYDTVSRAIQAMDPLGNTSSVVYDGLNRVVQQIDPLGQSVSFAYDADGNLLSLTDPLNLSTTFAYDALNRVVTRTTPLGKTDTRAYDLAGNLVAFTDRRGQASRFNYDMLDRLVGESYADGSTVTRTYDVLGRLIQADDSAGGAFSFSYDLDGRLTQSQGPFATVRYWYDALGRTLTRQVTGQSLVTYAYDPAGNLLSATMPNAGINFSYDDRNEVVGMTRMNQVASQFTYDAVGRLLTISHAAPSGSLYTQSYTYDPAGRRISSDVTSGQTLFTPAVENRVDAGDRPIASEPSAAPRDAAGNLFNGATTFSYDDAGNMTAEGAPAGATFYSWDSRGRLRSIARPGAGPTTFRYDFAGNLIEQRDPDPRLSRRFVLDDLTNVAAISDAAGGRYDVLTGQGIDSHFATVRADGTAEYALTDGLNSTVLTTDPAGAVQGRFGYEPYGQGTAAGSNFPFQYTGRVPVSASLDYYRARFYGPTLGRFVSEDPLGFRSGQISVYAYAGQAPVSESDAYGLSALSLAFGPSCPVERNRTTEDYIRMHLALGDSRPEDAWQSSYMERERGNKSTELRNAEHYLFSYMVVSDNRLMFIPMIAASIGYTVVKYLPTSVQTLLPDGLRPGPGASQPSLSEALWGIGGAWGGLLYSRPDPGAGNGSGAQGSPSVLP